MIDKKPKKWFGQNFLIDSEVIAHIINLVTPQKKDYFVEIGAGRGALTESLAPHVKTLYAIEIDRDLVSPLQKLAEKHKELHILIEDILKVDLKSLVKRHTKLRIIGNLPYHLATIILFHLTASTKIIKDIHVMVQKEVADRLLATSGNKAYGRLTIMANWHYKIEHLFNVAPESFYPKPKVQSSVIRLIPRSKPLCQLINQALFADIVKQAFSHRRKTLKNALKTLLSASALQSIKIDASLRPEQLSIEQYVAISNLLAAVFHTNRVHLNQ